MKINLTIEINDEDLKKLPVGTRDEYQTYVGDYARIFDDSCPGWCNDPECNLLYLKQQERWCNDMLQKKGYVFLNDVYDILGFPRTKIGQVVGWIYDKKQLFHRVSASTPETMFVFDVFNHIGIYFHYFSVQTLFIAFLQFGLVFPPRIARSGIDVV